MTLVPGLQPWNALRTRLLPRQYENRKQEAGASGQCVPGLEPWNKILNLSYWLFISCRGSPSFS